MIQSIQSGRNEYLAVEQYLRWHEAGRPSQQPNDEVIRLQKQLRQMIGSVRVHQQPAMFRSIRNNAYRLLRDSGFADPIADISPIEDGMHWRVAWTVLPERFIYMTASGLHDCSGQHGDFRSDDPELLSRVSRGMVWLVRDQARLHHLSGLAHSYRQLR